MKIIDEDEESITFGPDDTEEYEIDLGLDEIAFDHEIKEDENGDVWVNIMDFKKFLDWFKKGLGLS